MIPIFVSSEHVRVHCKAIASTSTYRWWCCTSLIFLLGHWIHDSRGDNVGTAWESWCPVGLWRSGFSIWGSFVCTQWTSLCTFLVNNFDFNIQYWWWFYLNVSSFLLGHWIGEPGTVMTLPAIDIWELHDKWQLKVDALFDSGKVGLPYEIRLFFVFSGHVCVHCKAITSTWTYRWWCSASLMSCWVIEFAIMGPSWPCRWLICGKDMGMLVPCWTLEKWV